MRKLLTLLHDPAALGGKLSSTRAAGLALVAAGIVYGFLHPGEPTTLGEFLAMAALSLGLRAKADASPSDSSPQPKE